MKFSVFQISRRGGREKNEDRMGYCYTRESGLFVLADGMGGHPEGEVAAQIAMQTVAALFQRQARPVLEDVQEFLSSALLAAHHQILRYASDKGMIDSPRTTLVAAVVQAGSATWIHCGDSRLYMVHGGELLTRTRDHSRVQLLMDQGVINEAQAAVHPDRNKVYSCLGGRQTPEIEFSRKTPLEAGDVLALCTDGLWGVIPGEIQAVALKTENLMKAVPMLLDQADSRGGPSADNLSIVVVRWEDSYVEDGAGASSVVSTQTMSRDTITTTLDAFGRNPQYKTELSDEEIERAINEIRSTIQKYSK